MYPIRPPRRYNRINQRSRNTAAVLSCAALALAGAEYANADHATPPSLSTAAAAVIAHEYAPPSTANINGRVLPQPAEYYLVLSQHQQSGNVKFTVAVDESVYDTSLNGNTITPTASEMAIAVPELDQ